jgi:hypothetical protein
MMTHVVDHAGLKLPFDLPRVLFQFIRASDRVPMSCELRFHGESYGSEPQFFVRGEFHVSRGAFP